MLHLADDRDLLACALDGEFSFLAGLAFEHGPDLSHGRLGHGDAIDGEEVIAHLNFWHRWLAFEIGDAEHGEAAVVFGTESKSNNVEIRSFERGADFEI